MGDEVLILPMTTSHIAALAEIERACFADPWSAQSLRDALENTTSRFLIAQVDGTVAGYIGVYLVADEGTVANLAVLPRFRRRGIGQALLITAEQNAKAAGCTSLFLEVRESNTTAITLYTQAGFRSLGTRRNFYSHPTEDARVMAKQLTP